MLLKTRQFLAFLIPGSVWVFSGLMLVHIPQPPLFLITRIEPGWIQVGIFLVLSYIIGFAIQIVAFKFAVLLAENAARLSPKLFADREMERRVAELEARVWKLIEHHYADFPGFRMPEAKYLFGFCKRLLRTGSVPLYEHLDIYEEEINLLSLTPLPLLVFAATWLLTWLWSDPTSTEYLRYIVPGSLAAVVAAGLCVARLKPMQAAETKETFESFIAFHLHAHHGGKEAERGVTEPR